jgi:phosphotransferase system HPr (HPr) family protein
VDARSVLSLLSLAAGRGTRLRLRAVGADADEAVAALGALLESPPEAE